MLLAPILACLIFPLDNTTSSCEDKSNTFFLYFSELLRRNSLRHNLVSNLYLLFIKRPFGLFDISVSGLHPTFGGSSGIPDEPPYDMRCFWVGSVVLLWGWSRNAFPSPCRWAAY